MSRLHTEQQRLFGHHAPAEPSVVPDEVRAFVLALHSPADWAALAPLWRGVQADFDWPEPAIAVNGSDAFELWFALADPMPRAEAAELLTQLQRRYLADVRADRLRAWPAADAAPPVCPPFAAGPERWAAFVSPDLPAVFGDDPALDFEPGADAQADLMARLRPITATLLCRARAVMTPAEKPAPPTLPAAAAQPATAPAATPAASSTGTITLGQYNDPRAFLLSVMNDPATPLALRIEAAKGLLQAPGR
ncbi:MAG: hypothetical protein ACKOXQ_03425 [Hydrogenophaga sp.]